MHLSHRPFALIILDGWGYREDPEHNAITAAHTPNWHHLWQSYAHTLISGSGKDVGLPDGQMGNSEVGHMNIGAGRVVYQDLTRIDQAIEEGEFLTHAALVNAVKKAKSHERAVHVLGLLSPGGVHSHEQHLHALVDLAAKQGITQLYIHAFLDGRDTPPKSAMSSLKALEEHCHQCGVGKIASIIGRYYAMDRDKRWERTEVAYDLLVSAKAGYHATTAIDALEQAYQRGETDEFVKATTIHAKNQSAVTIDDGDVVIFMNFRSDRARQLVHAFVDQDFTGFDRKRRPCLAEFVTLTEYAKGLPVTVAYPPQELKMTLGEYVAQLGLRQLRIAETEKYAHVTFFFNGGREQPFSGEDRVLIPSLKIATYDLEPEMSAITLTDRLVDAIASQQYDVIICNYANPDMVGHTGNFAATVKAIETIDACIGRVVTALQTVGGEAFITSDHGNAECMYDEKTAQPHTAHTSEPVPFLYVGRPAKVSKIGGNLADIAPTILAVSGLPKPKEMTGESLLQLISE